MQLDFRSSTSYSYPVFGKGEKMEIIPYRFGAGRFIFAENALSSLQEEIRRYGTNAFFLMGEKAFSLMEQFGLFEQETGLVSEKEIYEGFPTEEELMECKDKLTALKKRAGGAQTPTVLIGIGGGRIMDLAKAVAAESAVPLILIPTSAATCAAYSPLSVLYSKEGKVEKVLHFEKEIDSVIVDGRVLTTEPARLLKAGILDAMAKYVEILHGGEEITAENSRIEKYFAKKMAEDLFLFLEEKGKDAVYALERGEYSKTLSDVFFSNIAYTGLISGLMRGRGQAALAHVFYNFLRGHYPETKDFYHGEMVGVGLLLEARWNRDRRLEERLQQFLREMDMAKSLYDLGLEREEEVFEAFYRYCVEKKSISGGEEEKEKLRDAFSALS